ncbi:hypothetical protein D5045_22245 [Verminephrobacter eiseniae]|uniref:hypothetical protein n=1 Tax=Verminephrobacter eiseniae TaxID=364317 RepID=UPI0022371E48|nr:hypothetical protein [Verminephrobacter eiseniae]MCW5262761.1 hypothetical protein [Verminephrobacter eiseniae]
MAARLTPARLRPMLLAGRWLPWLCLLAALLAAALAGARAFDAWQAAQTNQQMSAGLAAPGAPAPVLLAHAIALERQGRFDEALSAYADAQALGSDSVRQAVRVNVANLYLRRGIEAARDEGSTERAMALLQLAKSGYRRALRIQPDDWNTRYNFELALRVLPDLEVRNWRRPGSDLDDEAQQRLLKDKAAWTEMVGPPRGMH